MSIARHIVIVGGVVAPVCWFLNTTAPLNTAVRLPSSGPQLPQGLPQVQTSNPVAAVNAAPGLPATSDLPLVQAINRAIALNAAPEPPAPALPKVQTLNPEVALNAAVGSSSPAMPRVWTLERQVSAPRGSNGMYVFNVGINNETVPMMLDTGASSVSLRAEDLPKLGLSSQSLRYTEKRSTANGITDVAPITIPSMSIGPITVYNIPAVVSRPGALNANLLGQTFLQRLRGFRYESDRVVLVGN